ncbi:hypothetical protein OWM54_01635 [Myxococcus sp. MISCRS1]|uniref:hypothetical protein n=1 Tax=Myxococcus sp. MISCRS1 TaxID=2996786 RepID=UPI002270F9CB|nr:hypothetical protein [Myxococcus sp. MISCRS1]MCY0995832.1 hypothetical protein [Myxococcus sp. MISCRS1]
MAGGSRKMGYCIYHVAFEGPAPSFETLRDLVAARLGTPVDLIETPPGFWVGMGKPNGGLSGFSLLRHEGALEPEWDSESPDDALLFRILEEFGGRRALVNSPAPRRVRWRFYFTGTPPTPEQVEARFEEVTGIVPERRPSERAYEFPVSHSLEAPMLLGPGHGVSLFLKSYGISLTTGFDLTLLTEVLAVLESLGGRQLDHDDPAVS